MTTKAANKLIIKFGIDTLYTGPGGRVVQGEEKKICNTGHVPAVTPGITFTLLQNIYYD